MNYPLLFNIKDINGNETDYFIDDGCNVFQYNDGEYDSIHIHNRKKDGRPIVYLNLDNGTKTANYLTYRLLMRACSGMPDNEFNKYVVDHIDCDPTHNVYDNFELVSQAENMRRAGENKLIPYGERHFNSKYKDSLIHNICQDICDNIPRHQIMARYSINGQLIDDIRSGRSHKMISKEYLNKGFKYKEYDKSNSITKAKEVCELLEKGYSVSQVADLTGYTYNFVFPIYSKATFKYISKDYNF